MSSGSARGLSLTSVALETLSYAITLAYSYRNGFPFSTYGEFLFLTLQNIIIVLLIVHHLPPSGKVLKSPPQKAENTLSISVTVAAVLGGMSALSTLPQSQLALLQLATLPLSLFAKLPQIIQNYQARSTGHLSAFAVFANVLGCAARIFTTLAEVRDPVMLFGVVLAFLLNVVLAIQISLY